MHRFSSTFLLSLMLASLSTFAFAANPTFDIKTMNVGAVGGFMATGDFDADGNADFAVDTSKGVSVFFGDGAGNFKRVNTGGGGGVLQLADIDGDGHPDLIAANAPLSGPQTVISFRNNGDRTFTVHNSAPIPNWRGLGFAAGDFDGDGKADVALSTSPLTVEVLVGNGDGTFQSPHTVYTATVPADAIDPTAYNIDNVQVAGDFDGNGKTDFMISEGPTNLFGGDDIGFMLNQGGFNFTRQVFSQQGFTAAVPLDANADGKTDVGFTWVGCHTPCGGGDVWTLAGGTPQQVDSASWDDALQGLPGSPVAADFNGDGQRDIAWSYGTFSTFTAAGSTPPKQSVLIHLGPQQVNPANQQIAQYDVGPDENFNPDAMVTADFNNDGAADLVVLSQTHGAIRVLLNTTVGVVQPGFRFAVAPAAATVTAGQSATLNATLTPTGGFTQQVKFSCSGLPAGAACTFTPSAIVPSNGSAKATVTITTTARASSELRGPTAIAFYALTLPFFGMICLPGGARRNWKRLLLIATFTALLALTLAACGGASGPAPNPNPNPPSGGGGGGTGGGGGGGTTSAGTPAGTYTVTLTAQSGAITHVASVRLKVQ